MRFSEAMRLGASLRPQTFGRMYRRELTGWTTCAIGAVVEAIGLFRFSVWLGLPEDSMKIQAALDARWPWLMASRADCPACKCNGSIYAIVIHLNDDHRWSREGIARWVEVHEPTAVVPESEQAELIAV